MRLVIQRVKQASVTVEGEVVGSIEKGMLLLVGFGSEDDPDLPIQPVWNKLLDKVVNLRIFPDQEGKTNLSLVDVQGAILAVSQFTLYGDLRKGRRPGFDKAAEPETARRLYDRFVADLKAKWPAVETGRFGAEMEVGSINWGPVTFILDTGQLA